MLSVFIAYQFIFLVLLKITIHFFIDSNLNENGQQHSTEHLTLTKQAKQTGQICQFGKLYLLEPPDQIKYEKTYG